MSSIALPTPVFVSRRSRRRSRRSKRSRRGGRRRRARKLRATQPYAIVRKLKTNTYFELDGTTNPATQILKLNSAYDPLGSASATQQGLGYDQYEAIYKRYCVVGWKVKLEICASENTYPIVCGFTPTTLSSALTTYSHYKECPGTVSRLLTPDVDKSMLIAKGSVKRWMLPKGGKILSDDLLSAQYNVDPSKILYGHIWSAPANSTNDTGVARFVVTLEQIVMFYDPKIPSQSTQ